MDNILVTGGAGFIGSSLADKLLEYGSKVIIIDNFNDFYDPAIKEQNINEIQKHMRSCKISDTKLKLYRQDIRYKEALHEVFIENKINSVVHLAAMAGVRPSIDAPGL